jgi:hypothetical protein
MTTKSYIQIKDVKIIEGCNTNLNYPTSTHPRLKSMQEM